jgi:hypothetical protein
MKPTHKVPWSKLLSTQMENHGNNFISTRKFGSYSISSKQMTANLLFMGMPKAAVSRLKGLRHPRGEG